MLGETRWATCATEGILLPIHYGTEHHMNMTAKNIQDAGSYVFYIWSCHSWQQQSNYAFTAPMPISIDPRSILTPTSTPAAVTHLAQVRRLIALLAQDVVQRMQLLIMCLMVLEGPPRLLHRQIADAILLHLIVGPLALLIPWTSNTAPLAAGVAPSLSSLLLIDITAMPY